MKITAQELRRMILTERKRIKMERSLRRAVRGEVRSILSEQKGKVKGKVVAGARKVFGVNMKKLKAADTDTYNEMVDLMEKNPDYDADQKWGPVALYNQAATNVMGRPDPNLVAQLPVKGATVTAGTMTDEDVKAAQQILKDRQGIVTTDDPDEEWEYKVENDIWLTRKKDKSTDWIKLGGKKFCKAVKKLDDLFPDMRSASAKSATKKLCAPAKKGAEAAVEKSKPEEEPEPETTGEDQSEAIKAFDLEVAVAAMPALSVFIHNPGTGYFPRPINDNDMRIARLALEKLQDLLDTRPDGYTSSNSSLWGTGRTIHQAQRGSSAPEGSQGSSWSWGTKKSGTSDAAEWKAAKDKYLKQGMSPVDVMDTAISYWTDTGGGVHLNNAALMKKEWLAVAEILGSGRKGIQFDESASRRWQKLAGILKG